MYKSKKDERYYENLAAAEMCANYIVDHKSTIREAVKKCNVSIGKSALHRYIKEVLPRENPKLYKKVREVLDKNLRERHIRGGIATKLKYNKSNNSNNRDFK